MDDPQSAYDELYVYSMGRPNFILQHVVDAQQAQTATEDSKPMGLVFSLMGLFLHVERGFSGSQVQQLHRQLARHRRQWPTIPLAGARSSMTVVDVMAVPAGAERDAAIDRWCVAVWNAFSDSRHTITALLSEHGIK